MSAAWLNRCHFGDVRAVLRKMIADGVQVHTIVTSPPYWGLRSYLPADHPDKAHEIGSEPTIGEFIATMVEVFDLCRQVLRDDGTLWVNMGDSYATRSNGPTGANVTSLHGGRAHKYKGQHAHGSTGVQQGFKHKDLIGQPWRLAFALQDDGWWLRQEIIWSKPNPMPESMTDRFTKAHEQVFLLAKSQKYYFDQKSTLEPVSPNTHARLSQNVAAQVGSQRANGGAKSNGNMKAVGRGNGVGWGYADGADAKPRTLGPKAADQQNDSAYADGKGARMGRGAGWRETAPPVTHRNRRSVWHIATESYSGAHFATYPRKLIEPCILAGCPPGGTVLDIFFGSGTTGQVAQALGRNFIGIDLNEANKPLQDKRLRQPSLIFEEPLHDEAERDVA